MGGVLVGGGVLEGAGVWLAPTVGAASAGVASGTTVVEGRVGVGVALQDTIIRVKAATKIILRVMMGYGASNRAKEPFTYTVGLWCPVALARGTD